MRVLLVDDEQGTAHVFSKLLARAGHDVQTANDGEAALTIAARFAPEAVLIDLVLPGMDGFELARRLRGTQDQRSLRLVALSGCDLDPLRDRLVDFDGYLTKPAMVQSVLELIERDARASDTNPCGGQSVTAG